ncbi:hypothetical protein [Dactylosporangium sp. CA-092794]|uniref:hypothetical protein n=1 Tax=Dactylosporangium sp. CA-092794 TaxID=3239929 RepID=UPI003D8FABD4
MLIAGAAGLLLAATAAGCAQDSNDSAQGASQAPTSATSSAAASSQPSAASSVKYFKTEITPDTGVAAGAVLTTTSTGATPSTAYLCLVAVFDASGGGVSAPDKSTLKNVKSDADGKLTCEVTYKPFSAPDTAGVTRHCPTTAADQAAGFKCGVVLADAATVGAVSASAVAFTPKE